MQRGTLGKLISALSLSAILASVLATSAIAAPQTAPLAAAVGHWVSLGATPLNGGVFDIEIINGELYIAGDFTDAGGDPNADGVAKLENGDWIALGNGLGVPAFVRTIAYDGTYIYVGGDFHGAGVGADAGSIAKFDGTDWSSLNGTSLNQQVHDIEIINGILFAGGGFTNAGGLFSYIAAFNGSLWVGLGLGTTNGLVRDIEFDGSSVYVAGDFPSTTGNPEANFISRFDGASWAPLNSASTALSSSVYDMEFSGGELYIGGEFMDAGTLSPGPDYTAKLEGGTWVGLDAGLNGDVYKLAMINGVLYAGGIFTDAGGDPDGDLVAKFENGVWSSLGGPGSELNDPALDFAFYNGALYAAGTFTDAGGDPDADGIAMFVLDPPATPPSSSSSGNVASAPIAPSGITTLELDRIMVTVPASAIPPGQTGCVLTIQEAGSSAAYGFALDDTVWDVKIHCNNNEINIFFDALTVCARAHDGVTANKNIYHNHNAAGFQAISGGQAPGYICGQTRLLSLFTLGQLSLPATGFAPGRISTLPPKTSEYATSRLALSIPKLGVELDIMGIPQGPNGWDVTWLGNGQAGYLHGTAFPTWQGNSVLTAHVWNADNTPGPFYGLSSLRHGDQFTISAHGYTYTYEVRSNQLVNETSLNVLASKSQYSQVTLITCESFDTATGLYLHRRAVQAVLVLVGD